MTDYQLPHWVFELRGRVFTLETAMEFIMAQLDLLTDALNAIASDVDAELAKVTDLETQLTALQNSTPPEVDLTGAIALATSIRERLEGVATAASTAADTAAQPAS